MRTLLQSSIAALLVALALTGCGQRPNNGDGSNNGGDSSNNGNDGTNNGDATGIDGTTGMDANVVGFDVTSDGPIHVSDAGIVVTDDAGNSWVCHQTSCAGHMLECGDCMDNDGDGLVDSHDPECLGPCDNTERADLLTGVGGETGGPCKSDCYFDFGNGSGGQDCTWDHRCDPNEVAPNYYPEGMSCAYEPSRVGSRDCPATQPANCRDHCGPLTPNGCDCFGCCTFPQLATAGPGGTPAYVWLGSRNPDGSGSCTFDQIRNPAACHTCQPVAQCLNECGPCEVCIGRPMPPPECFPQSMPDAGPGTDVQPIPVDSGPPPGSQCGNGLQPCGLPGQAECAFGYYCISGCCQAAPP